MSTTVTVGDILSKALPTAIFNEHDHATLSTKPWTNAFGTISHYTVYPATKNGLDTMFHPLDRDDSLRLNRQVHDMNDDIVESHVSEDDTVATWFTQVYIPVILAFQQYPHVFRRSGLGPPDGGEQNVIVDQFFARIYNDNVHCIVPGELKKCKTIISEEWCGLAEQGSVSRRLGRELRG
jgi:hypothetical protein